MAIGSQLKDRYGNLRTVSGFNKKTIKTMLALSLLCIFLLAGCTVQSTAIDEKLLLAIGVPRAQVEKQLGLNGDESYEGQGFDPRHSLQKSFSYGGKSIDTALAFSPQGENQLIYTMGRLSLENVTEEDLVYLSGFCTALFRQLKEPSQNQISFSGGIELTEANSKEYLTQLSKLQEGSINLQYNRLSGNYGMVNVNIVKAQESLSLTVEIYEMQSFEDGPKE